MPSSKNSVLQPESLQRFPNNDQLNQVLWVVKPRNWLSLLSVGMIVVGPAFWSVYGRIPITVEGKGVLIHPRQVVPLQSTSAGQVLTIDIKVGDEVRKGQVLATLDQTELRKQLQQQRTKLAELQQQASEASQLQKKGSVKEITTLFLQRQNNLQRIQELKTLNPTLRKNNLAAIQKQRKQLYERIKKLEVLNPILRQKSLDSLQKQRQSIREQIQVANEQLPILKKSTENRRQLLDQKVITEDVFFTAQTEYFSKIQEIGQLQAQLKEIDSKEGDMEERYVNNLNEISRNRTDLQRLTVEETNAQETYLKNNNDIAQLRAQLKDFDRQEANLEKQNLQDTNNRTREIQEVKREISKLELQLSTNSKIVSKQNGQILEITVAPSQVVNAGTRIGNINEEIASSQLVGITFFSIADGKKIQPGMTLQITPQTVKRERFGGILGNVTAVSSFPITKESAVSVVGNAEVMEGLISQKSDGLIQVSANLMTDPSTVSGYRWSSSRGPAIKISPGTTTVVRVKVEDRVPITYIFPILRAISGVY